MKYILTKEELAALREGKWERTRAETRRLQELCTLGARYIPTPDAGGLVWGCILDASSNSTRYCDGCPARWLCPNPHKELSQ